MTVKMAMFTTHGSLKTNGKATQRGGEHRSPRARPAAVSGLTSAPRSRTPNRPCGRTTSTAIRTTKNTNDDQVGEMVAASTASDTPMTSAATTAPARLPRPPRTMIVSRREIRS